MAAPSAMSSRRRHVSSRRSSSPPRPLLITSSAPILTIVLLIVHQSLTPLASAYRTGDALGLLLRTSSGTTHDALRSQMPLFGIPTSVEIDRAALAYHVTDDPSTKAAKDKMAEDRLSVGLTFGTGADAMSLPWVDVYDKSAAAAAAGGGRGGGGGRMLQTLEVTFVYTRAGGAGGGDVRSVSSRSTYAPLDTSAHYGKFTVDYVWVEEAEIDLGAGLGVMLGTVLVASLVLMVGACGGMGGGGADGGRGGKGGGDDGYASDATYGSYGSSSTGQWSGGQPGKWQ